MSAMATPVPLSVLDLAPVPEGSDAGEALPPESDDESRSPLPPE